MQTYFVKLSCGCCSTKVVFENDNAITKAFQGLGLTSTGELVDDQGKHVKDVDTFYGFSKQENEQQQKSLQYLAQQLTK